MALNIYRSEMDPLSQMERRMNSLFRDFLSDWGQLSNFSEPTSLGHLSNRPMGYWTPRADIVETDKAYIVSVELPGCDRKDISVEVKEDYVRVSGDTKKKEERAVNANDGSVRYIERRQGRYERVFGLPKGGLQDKTEAKFENGVLDITIPKKEQGSGMKRVDIK